MIFNQKQTERLQTVTAALEAPVKPHRCEYTVARWHGETCKRRGSVGLTGFYEERWFCAQHAKALLDQESGYRVTSGA